MYMLFEVLLALIFQATSIASISLYQAYLIRKRRLHSNFDYLIWTLIGGLLFLLKYSLFRKLYRYTEIFTENPRLPYLIPIAIIFSLDMVLLGLILKFINSNEKKI